MILLFTVVTYLEHVSTQNFAKMFPPMERTTLVRICLLK